MVFQRRSFQREHDHAHHTVQLVHRLLALLIEHGQEGIRSEEAGSIRHALLPDSVWIAYVPGVLPQVVNLNLETRICSAEL